MVLTPSLPHSSHTGSEVRFSVLFLVLTYSGTMISLSQSSIIPRFSMYPVSISHLRWRSMVLSHLISISSRTLEKISRDLRPALDSETAASISSRINTESLRSNLRFGADFLPGSLTTYLDSQMRRLLDRWHESDRLRDRPGPWRVLAMISTSLPGRQ